MKIATLALAALVLLAGCAHLAPAGGEDADARLTCQRAADNASRSRYTEKWNKAFRDCLEKSEVQAQ